MYNNVNKKTYSMQSRSSTLSIAYYMFFLLVSYYINGVSLAKLLRRTRYAMRFFLMAYIFRFA